ncbi:aquaporin [Clostridia bacterium]|nr:aquaporin [Clostridia bacterium]
MDKNDSSMRKYLAEAIGTWVLTFMGCGSAVVLGASSPGGHLAVALAFGLAIVATAYTVGQVSGCHINPAVSFAMWLHGKLETKDFVGYVVAQVAGAILAGLCLRILANVFGQDLSGALGSNSTAKTGIGGAFFVEILLTFIFLYTILGVTSSDKFGSVAGVVIGLTLAFVHIVGIPLTGTSVNPARSIGPAIFAGAAALKDVWVFIVAPLLGAGLAVGVYRLTNGEK